MSNKLRVGLIGCGGMAGTHVSRFKAVQDRMDVVAVVDIKEERAVAVAKKLWTQPQIATDYRDVLDAVDAVLLVLPHHLHADVTIDCLEAGKHVLVEKPMANAEAECRAMMAAAEAHDRVLMVAYCMRFHPLVRRLQELLAAETFGPVFQLSIWTEQLTRYEPGHWAHQAKLVGGGQFFSHGCHYVDLLLWMLGQPLRGSHFGTNRGTPWLEGEGTSNVVIEFENGILGYHFGTWGARGSRLKYSFHAHCEEAMLEIDLRGGKLIAHADAGVHVPGQVDAGGKQEVLLEAPNAKPTQVEMAHFIDCIETGTTPKTNAADSLAGLQVIWELYAAEKERRLADLSPIRWPPA